MKHDLDVRFSDMIADAVCTCSQPPTCIFSHGMAGHQAASFPRRTMPGGCNRLELFLTRLEATLKRP